MYGCAITCSDTSSSLGVSQASFSAGFAFSVVGTADLSPSNFTLSSLMLPPFDQASATGTIVQALALAWLDSSRTALRTAAATALFRHALQEASHAWANRFRAGI